MLRVQPRAIAARYNQADHTITVDIHWGFSITFAPERVQELQGATPQDLAIIEIDYPGWSLRFPKTDAGIQVSSMLQGRFGNKHWEADWAAVHQVEPVAA